MKAIILAAGYATRLYPLTLNRPKALLDIHGKPIINYIIEGINEINAINKIYVITNGLFANHFKAWEKNIISTIPIKIVNDGTFSEETRLGAIGDLQYCIQEEAIDDDVIIIAGDNFFNFSLNDFYNFYVKYKTDSVCLGEIKEIEKLKNFAVAEIKDNYLIGLVEKPQQPKTNIVAFAIYIYKRETLSLISPYLNEGNSKDAPGYFLEWLYKKQKVSAYKINGQCYDIGTLEGYNYVQGLKNKINNCSGEEMADLL